MSFPIFRYGSGNDYWRGVNSSKSFRVHKRYPWGDATITFSVAETITRNSPPGICNSGYVQGSASYTPYITINYKGNIIKISHNQSVENIGETAGQIAGYGQCPGQPGYDINVP